MSHDPEQGAADQRGCFGHEWSQGTIDGHPVHVDTWGSGPFLIRVGIKSFRFEDSDRFGPALVNQDNSIRANPWPGERSPFWRAHRLWVRQGRRVEADGATCIWDEPRPTRVQRIAGTRRQYWCIEAGEEDGALLIEPGEFVPELPRRPENFRTKRGET